MATATVKTNQTMNNPKPSKRGKRALKLLAILLVVVPSLLAYFAYASRFPDAINMSSTTHTHTTGAPGAEPISIETLHLGETDAPLKSYTLTAEVITRPGLPDQWGFNGTVPGPELRVKQGDHVQVTLVNNLPVSTSIHWHGVNVPNIVDGVAGVTQDAVQPGQSYTYDFLVDDPGTYWYHSHQDVANQIPRGLLGALIVEPEKLPDYDHDYTLMYHDREPYIREFLPILGKILGDIDLDAILVNNSNNDTQLTANPGDLIRLRLINATAGEHTAFGDPMRIVPLGVEYQVVALDGHDLHEPQTISNQILPIGTGQRYDIVFRMPDTGVVRLVGEQQNAIITLGQGEIATPDLAQLPTFDFTSYGTPTDNPLLSRSSFDNVQDFILGNRPGFHDGRFGLNHTINGKEFPYVPMITVEPGQAVKLHIVNDTEEFHPIHIHGHYFTVLAKNGTPLSGSPVYVDSILLSPGETWDVAFFANNPGLWMIHCHVLIHAATGMDTMVVYPNIETPYTVGRASGNIPE
jgi:FtsP/CotA-like multicopper oxidase with cupredoxin domain